MLPFQVEHHFGKEQLKHKLEYRWVEANENKNLLGIVVESDDKGCLKAKHYTYGSSGEVTRETLVGMITRHSKPIKDPSLFLKLSDHYSRYFVYSQDAFHNLIHVSDAFGLHIEVDYYEGTDLVREVRTYCGEKISSL